MIDSLCVLRVENQGADLDTLPREMALGLRVHKCSMGDTPSAAIRLGIKALDESHNVGRLAVPEIPLVLRIGLDRIRLSLTIRVDQLGAKKIAIRDRMSIRDSQWTFINGFNWTPNVDDLVSALQEIVSFVGKVI
jgi:hypothetical protein